MCVVYVWHLCVVCVHVCDDCVCVCMAPWLAALRCDLPALVQCLMPTIHLHRSHRESQCLRAHGAC